MAIGGSDSVRKDLINKIISIYKILIDRCVVITFLRVMFYFQHQFVSAYIVINIFLSQTCNLK